MARPNPHLFRKIKTLFKATFVCAAAMVAAPQAAYAVCSVPAGNAGEIIYNGDDRLMSYCDNTNWIGLYGRGGSWLPTDLAATPILWFDATDAANISHTAGAVSTWTDKINGRVASLDSGSGDPAYSTTQFDGTWSDTSGNDVAEETTACNVDTCLTFDGVDDYINMGDPADGSLDFSNTQDITLSAWIKITAPSEGGFIAHKTNGAANSSYWMGINGDGATTMNWDGQIDDARIYGRALSTKEILGLYNATK